MPITCRLPITPLAQKEFSELDYRVMGMAFEIHSEYGRFCHESVYQAALAQACLDAGLHAATEVKITVSHAAFCKHLYVDLLIGSGALYELKTAERLVPQHRAQTLSYLMLLGLPHGKLINWRSPSVQSEFISTTLTHETRQEFTLDDRRWNRNVELADDLLRIIKAILCDWGAFLNADLYRDAIQELVTGGPSEVQKVTIRKGSRKMGHQHLHLVAPQSGLVVSASTSPDHFERHLQRLLDHTPLATMFWVNLNKHNIQCTTLFNRSL